MAAVALAGALAAGCAQAPSMLISITADGPAEQYDLYIRDDASQTIIFHSGFNPVLAPGESGVDGTRDLTKDALKIAVKLSKGGNFTLLLVGVIGETDGGKPAPTATQFFWAGHVHVEGATHVDARLLTVPAGDDHDQDLWPDVSAFPMHVPEAATLYAKDLDLLDCDDKMDNPVASTGKVVMLTAASINPYAVEICGDGYDEDCSGDGDEPCIDKDGDGDPRGDDCNDDDATRHHPTATDPFPDPPNCCGYSLGKQGTPNAGVDYLHAAGDPACFAASCMADAMLCPKQRCGDGIDEACKGGAVNDPMNDTNCVIDADCDGYPAPPQGNDCNDHDPNIHPGAVEICGDNINQSCNPSGADSGCVPCDVDGDGYQRKDVAASCPTAAYTATGRALDCDDYDAGVYPGSTTAAGGKEGGINVMGRVATGLKGLCRTIYEPTGVTGTAKVAISGFTAGDADCNGTAFQGCPPASCDADGDGWPANACGALNLTGPFDCNDNDPTIFPGAPDKCGDGVDGSCSGADTACNGMDMDGDGYLPPADCDDTNPAIHPFALELCNGKDDDCDGDTDEGNPDPSGMPLVMTSAISSCTDSNLGLCAMPLGLCACSPTKPVAYTDPAGMRTFCSGETATSARLPHCFGAGQPTPQTCDGTKVDNDCDGSYNFPAPNPAYSSSQALAIMGKPCGINVGKCVAGTAIGCNQDTAQTYFGNQANMSDEYWVCKNATSPLPAELCNGYDDTCVGSLAANEQDLDMDGYMSCSPCAGIPLAGTLKGCGDCNDAYNKTYPGAEELCDNQDNNCNGTVDEAPNECSLANNGTTCCSSQMACRNLTNGDTNDCGACGMTCTLRLQAGAGQPANNCAGGSCVCGNTGSACGSGQYCSGSSCSTCNTSTFCGPNCTPCGTSQVCKSDGSACTGCNNDNDCSTSTYCAGGNCVPRNPQGGSCTPNGSAPNAINDNCLQTGIPLYCTDNLCCNQPPSMCGGCQQCNKGGSMGTCANVAPGSDPHNTCTVNVALCELDTCNGAGSCAAPDGADCGPLTCVDNATESHTQEEQCAGGSLLDDPDHGHGLRRLQVQRQCLLHVVQRGQPVPVGQAVLLSDGDRRRRALLRGEAHGRGVRARRTRTATATRALAACVAATAHVRPAAPVRGRPPARASRSRPTLASPPPGTRVARRRTRAAAATSRARTAPAATPRAPARPTHATPRSAIPASTARPTARACSATRPRSAVTPALPATPATPAPAARRARPPARPTATARAAIGARRATPAWRRSQAAAPATTRSVSTPPATSA